jgi:O-antigen/teichoic acid export membrane protein
MQVRGLIEAGLRALMPEISRIGTNMTIQAKNRIAQLNSRATKLIFFFGVPVYTVLMIFTPLLLRIWLGGKFAETLPDAFRIMMVAMFFTLVGVPAYYTIIGLDRVRYLVTSSIIAVSCNCATVIIHCALMGHLSVRSIGLYMAMSFAAGTAYLICKVRHLFTGDNVRKG